MEKTKLIKNFLIDTAYFIWDVLKTIAVVIILFLVIRFYAIQPFIVEGQSMEPTLKPYEYLFIEKISYRLREPQRGDIVVFDYPKNPKVKFIKRIIALPEEKIIIKNGKVFIYNKQHPNGVQLKEDYLSSMETSGNISQTLKKDEYFVLGDNRKNSSDSRMWGALSKKNIVGRAYIILFPLSKIGIIESPIYKNLSLFGKKLVYQ